MNNEIMKNKKFKAMRRMIRDTSFRWKVSYFVKKKRSLIEVACNEGLERLLEQWKQQYIHRSKDSEFHKIIWENGDESNRTSIRLRIRILVQRQKGLASTKEDILFAVTDYKSNYNTNPFFFNLIPNKHCPVSSNNMLS